MLFASLGELKVLCSNFAFGQSVKRFFDREKRFVRRAKHLSIAKKIGAPRKRFVHREKDLCIAKKICAS